MDNGLNFPSRGKESHGTGDSAYIDRSLKTDRTDTHIR